MIEHAPWVKNPEIPWASLNCTNNCFVDKLDPALAILRARTRSSGYIIAAAQKDAASTGVRDQRLSLITFPLEGADIWLPVVALISATLFCILSPRSPRLAANLLTTTLGVAKTAPFSSKHKKNRYES